MKALGSTLVVILLAAGLTLIGYARWSASLRDADAALDEGRLEQAIAGYQTAEGRYDAVPAVKQLVAREYNRAVGNHLLALYRLKRYDEVIDLAQKAPRSQRGTPRLADEATSRKIIDRLAKMSAPLGTTIVYRNGIGVWQPPATPQSSGPLERNEHAAGQAGAARR